MTQKLGILFLKKNPMYIRLVLPTIWKNSSKFLYQKIETQNNNNNNK